MASRPRAYRDWPLGTLRLTLGERASAEALRQGAHFLVFGGELEKKDCRIGGRRRQLPRKRNELRRDAGDAAPERSADGTSWTSTSASTPARRTSSGARSSSPDGWPLYRCTSRRAGSSCRSASGARCHVVDHPRGELQRDAHGRDYGGRGLGQGARSAPRAVKLRLLHLITRLPVGGAERLLVDVVRGLDRARFESIVCCIQERANSPPSSRPPASSCIAWTACRQKALDWRAVRDLVRLMREQRIDVVPLTPVPREPLRPARRLARPRHPRGSQRS